MTTDAKNIEYFWTAFREPWRDAIAGLRFEVFVREQSVPLDEELDVKDETAEHLVAVIDGEIIGTLRVLRAETGLKVGRFAVRRDRRGRGIGKEMMRIVIDRAREDHAKSIALDAQVSVIPFYEKFGFAAQGHLFYDAGILHRRMTLSL